MATSINSFLQKVDKIVSSGASGSDAEKVKENLLTSLYLDLVTKIGLDPNNKQVLDELSAKKPSTVEEMTAEINLAQEKLAQTGFDINKAFDESEKDVLESFITQLEPNLSPEKITELRSIIATGA